MVLKKILETWQILSIIGIGLEIFGFIVFIKSTRILKPVDVAFIHEDKKERKKEVLPKALGTNRPTQYRLSIGLVITGLGFQVLAIFG